MKFTVRQIANLINGEVVGDDSAVISKFNKIEEGGPEGITFLSNQKYEPFIYNTKASAVIVRKDFKPEKEVKATLILVDDPYLAMSILMAQYEQMISFRKKGIENGAMVHETANIGEDAYIGAFAYLDENTVVGAHSQIYPHTYIGSGVEIGANCLIYSGAKIYKDCKIDDNCIVHSGAVIGADGFGFAQKEDGTYQGIPQLGNVVLEKNVSVGANTTIDRATMGSTSIGEGSKIDNLVQIGHNVTIGKNTVIVAQTGISGSTKIGNNCVIGGQVGIGGHISIADNTKIGAKSGVGKSINKPGQSFSGHPIAPYQDYLKYMIELRRLPETISEFKKTDN